MRKTWMLLGAATIAFAAVAADAPKPQYGAWGLDTAGMDKATKPGDDFFRFANGAWLDKTPIPGDKPGVSLRLAMTDRTEGRLHDMMEAAAAKTPHQPSDLEGKVGAFYKAFMDEAHVNALGAKPIAPELDAVRAAKTRDDLAALMGASNAGFNGSLFHRCRSEGSQALRRLYRPKRPRPAGS
jgi:putative endopeptidase